ncbi:hypothetical protein AGMMS50230_08850 [Spirochaetia bacterium]|nr:hypothetical protein AGMMS50230_08850 [Spirochaetia bacterium]
MFSRELLTFLIRVITSWQIIVVTVALVIYITLVSHVARMYHPRASFSFNSKPKKEKKEKPVEAEEISGGGDDDLGLEE